MPVPVTCWNCGNDAGQVHFCDSCHSLQPPSSDYYDFFGLPRRFHIDLAEMERRFYALSRRLHPDVYFRRSAREQQFSLDATAILNDAYRTLRDPVLRAEYLLKTEGLEPGGARVPPELLEEIFEWNLAVESADAEELAAARARFEALIEETARKTEAAFREFDAGGSRQALAEVRALLDRRSYLEKLLSTAAPRG
jgi:molecular chaperone HscB